MKITTAICAFLLLFAVTMPGRAAPPSPTPPVPEPDKEWSSKLSSQINYIGYFASAKAEKGSLTDQYWLGRLFLDSQGLAEYPKWKTALYWFEAAANAGHRKSMLGAAVASVMIDKSPAGKARAMEWVRKYRESNTGAPLPPSPYAKTCGGDEYCNNYLLLVKAYVDIHLIFFYDVRAAGYEGTYTASLQLQGFSITVHGGREAPGMISEIHRNFGNAVGALPIPQQILSDEKTLDFTYTYSVKDQLE